MAPLTSMLRMSLKAFIPTHVRESREPGNGGVDDNNEVGSKKVRRNVSKVNPS